MLGFAGGVLDQAVGIEFHAALEEIKGEWGSYHGVHEEGQTD